MPLKAIYTIGHSTHSMDVFIGILRSCEIELLVDIRSFPGSRRLPHFNKENLEKSLLDANMKYIHMAELGGRRKASAESRNTGWKADGFRGYADYMETETFGMAANKLGELAMQHRTVYMCAEALWWNCHRSLLSDWFKFKGWNVLHIMSSKKMEEHPYTKPAKIISGQLSYENDQLSLL